MTAAGEAVLAEALSWVGYVEGPDNSTVFWDWYGGNYGPWCGVFVMYCSDAAGVPCCTDCVLVSNGTWHGYTTGGDGATGVEAQRTLDLQPGDAVLFSWEPWAFEGGVPICQGDWQGYVAGDHIGVFHSWVDQGSGQFRAVEGNTSDWSTDNGGQVMLREDRWTSQVCGWWRPELVAAGGSPAPPEEVAIVYAPERVDVVGIGASRHVYLKTFWYHSGRWEEWIDLGGSAVDVSANWSGDQFNVFAVGPSGACYQNAWSGATGWTGWVDLGAPGGDTLVAGVGGTTHYVQT